MCFVLGTKMNIHQAKTVLSGALKFGDPLQIQAIETLSVAGESAEPKQCGRCKGVGEFQCSCLNCGNEHYFSCKECNGTGNV